ncbi:MAG: hypothetical protein U9Q77_04715 [Candidatus Marinimicrobia bacterium]|nr:hypothetical protein [Candidatus Neomarinimicrobiota bacterium]
MLARLLLLLMLLVSATLAAPIGQTGFIESNLSFDLDSTRESGSSFVHQERIAWGLQGCSNALLNLNYKLTLGGVLRGNTTFSKTQITPEYGIRTSLKPAKFMDLALFSYSRLRNPMQVFSDSLEYKEFVHGIKLGAHFSSGTRLSIATGIRSQEINHRDSIRTNQQFVQLHIDQRLAGMQFRLTGESDIWSRDTLASQQAGMTSLQWGGSPFKNLYWTASNSIYLTGDYNFWRLSHRLNYQLSQRQKIWARFSQGDFAYGSQTLLRRNYDLRYRFQWRPTFGLDLVFRGNQVTVPDSLDIFHWRSYGVSTHWNVGRQGFVRGNLDAGFKESYRYGKGIDVLLQATESKQLINSKIITLQIRDDLSAEFFQRIDETGDPRYDIRHKLRLTTTFLPGGRHQVGNHIKVHTHIGSDLDFSPDTLKNAIIDELYFKTFSQKNQFAVYYQTVLDIRDPDSDLRFSLNTRFFRRVTSNLSCNFNSSYRFQSEIYPDYLWLSAILKFRTDLFSYALELQSAGSPSTALEQDSRIWLRFVRQI